MQQRNETRIPDRACPENSLTLQVALEVENSRISVTCRLPQSNNDLDTVACSKVECVEEPGEVRILEKLRQPCTSAIGNSVNRDHVEIDVDAGTSPIRAIHEFS